MWLVVQCGLFSGKIISEVSDTSETILLQAGDFFFINEDNARAAEEANSLRRGRTLSDYWALNDEEDQRQQAIN